MAACYILDVSSLASLETLDPLLDFQGTSPIAGLEGYTSPTVHGEGDSEYGHYQRLLC
jgi:hypothetical protein